MDICISSFLAKYKPDNIEKHSDNSDIDEIQITQRVSLSGNHNLLNKVLKTVNKTKIKISLVKCKSSDNKQPMHPNLMKYENIPVHDYDATNQEEFSISLTRRNNLPERQTISYPNNTQRKAIPCFSRILERSNNYTQQSLRIKDIPQDNLNNGKTFCPDCERRRIKKLNRRRQSYVVQPVYAVDNIHGGPVPFGHANDRAPLSQHIHKAMRKPNSKTSYELTTSELEIGNKYQRKHFSRRRNFVNRFQKEMKKDYIRYERELTRNRAQQYPSKRDNNLHGQVFSTPYFQIISAAPARDGEHSSITSTSSGFWEYLFEKIRRKYRREKIVASKPCNCPEDGQSSLLPSPPQETDNYRCVNCTKLECRSEQNAYTKLKDSIPECKNCMLQTENINKETSTVTLSNKSGTLSAKTGVQCVKCKCCLNNKHEESGVTKAAQKSLAQCENVNKPCQKPHDDIIKTVEEKRNEEILYIHNPPRILINGFLDLPAPQRSLIQRNFWPVKQDKKSSFYQIFQKMRQPKNNREQVRQHHPRSIEVKRAMLIKAEKLVQSICNHHPPCEVVRGCYKAKYNPKLHNSCIHVPMCEQLPQCFVEEHHKSDKQNTKDTKLCKHRPKCAEVPLCSRKLLVLTVRDTAGTQVRTKTELVCRYKPSIC